MCPVTCFIVVTHLPNESSLDVAKIKNKLTVLKRKYYNDILDAYAVNTSCGYILPYENVNAFSHEVDELIEHYAQLHRQYPAINIISRVSIQLVPVNLYADYPDGVKQHILSVETVRAYVREKLHDKIVRIHEKLCAYSRSRNKRTLEWIKKHVTAMLNIVNAFDIDCREVQTLRTVAELVDEMKKAKLSKDHRKFFLAEEKLKMLVKCV